MNVRTAEALLAEFREAPEGKRKQWLGNAGRRLEIYQSRTLTDFWYYLWEGPYKPERRQHWPELHGPGGIATFLQDWGHIKTKVLVVNRSNCKTQESSLWMTWLLGRDQNERILVRSHKDEKAHEISGLVQNIILGKWVTQYWPWLKPAMDGKRRKKWAIGQWTVQRTIDVRTASLEACGLKSDVAGGHFTYRDYDDYSTQESDNSVVIREDLFETYKNDDNLGTGGCKTLITGTPYHKDGFINCAIKRKNEPFCTMDYELFHSPCYVPVFSHVYSGANAVLLDDRKTFRIDELELPEGMKWCQVKLRFFDAALKDYVEEIREVDWNDANHCRVNREIPEKLGQPEAWSIGNVRPNAPNRFTMDCIDLEPLPENADTEIVRESLVQKRRNQGAYVFSCQQELDPRDPENALFSEHHIVWLNADELPKEGKRHWFRAQDYASAKKTKCRTVIMDGFHHENGGIYVTHMRLGNLTPLDIMLELFLGELRLRGMGAEYRTTFFEEAAREEMLGDQLRIAEKDPHKYFKMAGGRYAKMADEHFLNCGSLYIHKTRVPRSPGATKGQRDAALQPYLEQRRVHVLRGIEGEDELREELNTFTIDSTEGFDTIDSLRDLVVLGYPPRESRPADERTYDFQKSQAVALRRLNRGTRRHCAGWPPR